MGDGACSHAGILTRFAGVMRGTREQICPVRRSQEQHGDTPRYIKGRGRGAAATHAEGARPTPARDTPGTAVLLVRLVAARARCSLAPGHWCRCPPPYIDWSRFAVDREKIKLQDGPPARAVRVGRAAGRLVAGRRRPGSDLHLLAGLEARRQAVPRPPVALRGPLAGPRPAPRPAARRCAAQDPDGDAGAAGARLRRGLATLPGRRAAHPVLRREPRRPLGHADRGRHLDALARTGRGRRRLP